MKLNNPSGDAISRETIEKVIVGILEKWGDGYPYIEIPTSDAIKIMKSAISEIPPVETKQDELLDYIKLSLKQSDEFKEKYRNEYEESNCQYDLYYSHLFEGMSEAYDDLLKKMGESDTQGKQDRPQGEWETVRFTPDELYEHYEKDYLFDEIRRFLKKYDIATLLQIVTDAVTEVEGD